ncbi:MAG: hypothetical protein A3J58_03535 [Candidatus Sungbacteria bacterium RIFCSPHIGHO2_02_FULL_52_23]|uniref:DNA-directed DNA polymerase n=1 Tax=Candidatus Sungbacteria bacterium RIFCSPHIGHO2_02_FULL_52_23 TaxID=1802274 RepID=A0A1G2KVL0_9BACT|nr:MAG: hypothetical protein A3J58_03535 [Candidatus Sungbacteria bacterium RIFCSPHIGHO2_02_FULL_52_23]
MNYLLYGADTFRSRRKLVEIMEAYRAKAGVAFNMHRFDAEEDDLARMPAIAGGQSLFEQKKLIIIERPFTFPRQFTLVRDALKRSAQDKGSLMIVWDSEVGQDAKKMLDEASALADRTQVFEILKGDKLLRWVEEEAKSRKLNLARAEILGMARRCGGDLWALSGEMEKRAVMPSESITTNQESRADATVFQLGDAFLVSPKDALRAVHTLLEQGENAVGMFMYLAGYARTLMLVRSYLDQGRPVPPRHGIHPFVVKKASAQVRSLSGGFLASILTRFFEEDIKIKTGLARPEEALVRLVTLTSQSVSSGAI